MRALITGGAGFIGSHLADALLARGDSVILLDNLSTGRLDNIEHLRARDDVEFVLGSILNADLLDDLMARADVCFHLAAAVGVQLIVDKPLESLATNIRGSEIVFEKAHKHGTKVLVTSTSEIYGKNTSDRLGEEDDRILSSPLKSRWSYSEAKAIEGEPITVYGTGAQTRCFCYFGDVVQALLDLADHPQASGRAHNIGGREEVSMEDLARRVIAAADSSSKIRYVPYDEAYEEGFEDMQRRVPDTTRARELIGFAPSVGLATILTLVLEDQRR